MSFEDLPEKFQPAWFRDKLIPLQANIPMNIEDIKLHMSNKIKKNDTFGISKKIYEENLDSFTKPSAKVTLISEDDENFPDIKRPPVMQSADANMWYENLDDDIPEDEIIDNNDEVDLEKVQIKAPDAISSIRQKLLKNKKKEEPVQKTMFAAPGEYVLFYNKQVVDVGSLSKVKVLAEDIIVNNENLSDDDLVIFLRVPLDKIFK